MDIPVIFEDQHILVINKPPGLVVTPSETHKVETLAEILETQFKIKLDRGGIVHRLDKDTSGLMVVAKTQAALEWLQLQFKDRQVHKQYLTLAHGRAPQQIKVKAAIGRNPFNREVFTVLSDGRESETEFKLEQSLLMTDQTIDELFPDYTKIQLRKLKTNRYPEYSLIRCFPLTGRTHQIRVHLKHLNLPMVADSRYGGRKTSRLDHRWCPRQFLHAANLEFYHPQTLAKVSFEAPLPDDLKTALSHLTPD